MTIPAGAEIYNADRAPVSRRCVSHADAELDAALLQDRTT